MTCPGNASGFVFLDSPDGWKRDQCVVPCARGFHKGDNYSCIADNQQGQTQQSCANLKMGFRNGTCSQLTPITYPTFDVIPRTIKQAYHWSGDYSASSQPWYGIFTPYLQYKMIGPRKWTGTVATDSCLGFDPVERGQTWGLVCSINRNCTEPFVQKNRTRFGQNQSWPYPQLPNASDDFGMTPRPNEPQIYENTETYVIVKPRNVDNTVAWKTLTLWDKDASLPGTNDSTTAEWRCSHQSGLQPIASNVSYANFFSQIDMHWCSSIGNVGIADQPGDMIYPDRMEAVETGPCIGAQANPAWYTNVPNTNVRNSQDLCWTEPPGVTNMTYGQFTCGITASALTGSRVARGDAALIEAFSRTCPPDQGDVVPPQPWPGCLPVKFVAQLGAVVCTALRFGEDQCVQSPFSSQKPTKCLGFQSTNPRVRDICNQLYQNNQIPWATQFRPQVDLAKYAFCQDPDNLDLDACSCINIYRKVAYSQFPTGLASCPKTWFVPCSNNFALTTAQIDSGTCPSSTFCVNILSISGNDVSLVDNNIRQSCSGFSTFWAWIQDHLAIFIVLIVLVVFFILFWALGPSKTQKTQKAVVHVQPSH